MIGFKGLKGIKIEQWDLNLKNDLTNFNQFWFVTQYLHPYLRLGKERNLIKATPTFLITLFQI